MTTAVIPARGGSKRILRKNVREFGGKPMIAWSIEAAARSPHITRVIVSTEDAEIAEVARACGAETPFIRPAKLADDFATTSDVMQHAANWLSDQGEADAPVCCIYATAPFVREEDLDGALKAFADTEADYVFSATSFPFPIQRAFRIDNNGRVEMFYPEHLTTRSQDLEAAYHDAGQFYWGSAAAWREKRPIFSKRSTAFLLPPYRVQDMDTPEDWERAEWMFKQMQGMCVS
ncbi:MAG: pseudaminic acid cytidylyltransferase [Hoeflea sp.]|uniref:pseudaminic acid cytidylyltransferase n=1 Tax=Hoeflea sp. TaxID=1940281 RepID=UPI0032F003E8